LSFRGACRSLKGEGVASPESMTTALAYFALPVFMDSRLRGNDFGIFASELYVV
jgi:hypothetical protein